MKKMNAIARIPEVSETMQELVETSILSACAVVPFYHDQPPPPPPMLRGPKGLDCPL